LSEKRLTGFPSGLKKDGMNQKNQTLMTTTNVKKYELLAVSEGTDTPFSEVNKLARMVHENNDCDFPPDACVAKLPTGEFILRWDVPTPQEGEHAGESETREKPISRQQAFATWVASNLPTVGGAVEEFAPEINALWE
jgi:hypothetical protein